MVVKGAEARTTDEVRTGGDMIQNNRCCNCDHPNFTREHMDKCPAREASCNFCCKIGHFEGTCRGKRGKQRGRGAVGMTCENDDNTHLGDLEDDQAS